MGPRFLARFFRVGGRPRYFAQRLGLTCGVTLATLGLLELGLRATREEDRFYPNHKNSLVFNYPSEELTPGITGLSRFTTNSLGCRGPEDNGARYRMLTIGGSTTANVTLDDSEDWTHLVMEMVNRAKHDEKFLWVTNSGLDGKTSRHHVMHAKYLVPKIGDLDIVLVYSGLNDAGQWLYYETFDPNYLDNPDHWNTTIAESFRVSNFTSPEAPWYKHFELWKRLSVVKDRFNSGRQRSATDHNAIIQDARLRWLAEAQRHRKETEKRFVPRAKLETLPVALGSYARNLRLTAKLIREAGARPIFMAQAIAWQSEEQRRIWMGMMDGGKSYVNEEQMESLIDAYNRQMAEVARSENVLFIDLPTALQGVKQRVFYDGCHFTEAGSAEVARIVSEALLSRVFEGSIGSPETPTAAQSHARP